MDFLVVVELKLDGEISCADATDEANRANFNRGRGGARGYEWFRMASITKLPMHNITPNHQEFDSDKMIDRNGVEFARQSVDERFDFVTFGDIVTIHLLWIPNTTGFG